MYVAHASALPFKDNLLESQIPTWAFTLVCTSNQFRSSWRSGPNHTPRMRMGPSLQRKGPGRVLLPLQAPSSKPSLLSKLTLGPAIRSYSTTASFTAFISRRQDTKTVMSSAKPAQEGLQCEDIEKRRQGAALPDRTLDREYPRTPSVHLHNCLRVMVHHANPSESGSLQNRRQEPMVDPIEGLGLI